jgi:hypothetical protein
VQKSPTGVQHPRDANQFRETRLYGLIAPLEGIIIRIRNLRPVIGMVKLIVMSNLTRQSLQFGSGFKVGQFFNENFGHMRQASWLSESSRNISKKCHLAYSRLTLRTEDTVR